LRSTLQVTRWLSSIHCGLTASGVWTGDWWTPRVNSLVLMYSDDLWRGTGVLLWRTADLRSAFSPAVLPPVLVRQCFAVGGVCRLPCYRTIYYLLYLLPTPPVVTRLRTWNRPPPGRLERCPVQALLLAACPGCGCPSPPRWDALCGPFCTDSSLPHAWYSTCTCLSLGLSLQPHRALTCTAMLRGFVAYAVACAGYATTRC